MGQKADRDILKLLDEFSRMDEVDEDWVDEDWLELEWRRSIGLPPMPSKPEYVVLSNCYG